MDRTKKAADLKPGDAVLIAAGDRRVVEAVEWPGTYIAAGTQAVRVHFFGQAHWNTLAADKDLTLTD
jgi:hypothetical protein